MSKGFRRWKIDEAQLLPPSVQDYVPPDHLSRLIVTLVREELDLSALAGSYRSVLGQPPFDPRMMTALLLHGYASGVYSSRRIAKAAVERADFMMIVAGDPPDFRTIAEFRKRHLKGLAALFVQVLRLAEKAGLVKLGHVALDGTKIKANASKHKAMSYGRMKGAEERLAAEVAGWMKKAAAQDAAEDRQHGGDRRGDELPDWVANKERRLAKIREAKAALEAEAQAAAGQGAGEDSEVAAKRGRKGQPPSGVPEDNAQRNFTDPESRIMKTKDGFIQGYNAQAAVDAEHQIIVSCDLTNQGTDSAQLLPLIDQIKANTEVLPKQVSADAGYASDANLKGLEEREIDGFVAAGRQKHGTAAPAAGKAKEGSRLAAMAQKIAGQGYDSPYRLRKQTVEPVFGQIKQARGFRQFLLRGLDKVKQEWVLVCTAHNLLKLTAFG